MALTVLSSGTASAQEKTIKIAVVPFRNVSSMKADMYSTMATDAFAVELMRSGKFDNTRAEVVDLKLMDLGLKTKTDRTLKVVISQFELQQLGRELGVSWIASGEIRSINVDNGRKRADVKVAVKILDVETGEWISGAYSAGVSQNRVGYITSREGDWIVEAINNAASNAVASIIRYMIPTATIVGIVSGTDEVLLNKGEDSGLRPGLQMMVIRREGVGYASHEDVVGRIRVTKVTDTDAYAKVINAPQGVRAEDRVIAVYELPGKDSTAPGSQTTKPKISSNSKWLWGLAALVGLAAFFKVGSGGTVSPEDGGSIAVLTGTAESGMPNTGDTGTIIAWNPPGHMATPTYTIRKNGVVITGQVTTLPPQLSGKLGGYANFVTDPSIQFDAPASYMVQSGTVNGPTVIATCVSRPTLMGTGESSFTSLHNIFFTWIANSTIADQYVLEVSIDDPLFSNRGTAARSVFVKQLPKAPATWNSGTELVNSKELKGLTGTHTIYWRVGCRRSADTQAPAACPGSGSDIWDLNNPKNTRWIYSRDYMSFTVNL